MHHLIPVRGWAHPWIGAILKTPERLDLRAKGLLVEPGRLFTAAFKKQIGLELHGLSFHVEMLDARAH